MTKKWYVVVLIAAFFALASAAYAENLLVNPGFENEGQCLIPLPDSDVPVMVVDPGCGDISPLGWAAYGESEYRSDVHKSGGQSAKTWNWDFEDGVFEQFVDIVPGKKYKASVYMWSKADDPISNSGEAWIQIEWCTIDNVVIGDPIKSPALAAANSTWELFETPSVTAPQSAAKAKIKIVQQSPDVKAGGSCYLDDASFSCVP